MGLTMAIFNDLGFYDGFKYDKKMCRNGKLNISGACVIHFCVWEIKMTEVKY